MTTRKAKQYIATAVESLTLAIELFNRPSSTGGEHATVMLAAHAFEMLLKAAIYESRGTVKFGAGDRSFDLGKCVRASETSLGILDAGDRVVLQALKEDRDTAIHDVIMMSDDVPWLPLRTARGQTMSGRGQDPKTTIDGHSERGVTAKMFQEFSTGLSAPTPNTGLRQLMSRRHIRLSLRTKSCCRSLSPNTSTGSAACLTMELPRTAVNPVSGSDPN